MAGLDGSRIWQGTFMGGARGREGDFLTGFVLRCGFCVPIVGFHARAALTASASRSLCFWAGMLAEAVIV